MSLVNVRARDVAVTTRATTKTTSVARHRGKISFPSVATRRRAVTTRATVRGDENARGGARVMRARGAIEDAVVTPEFEHVLATMVPKMCLRTRRYFFGNDDAIAELQPRQYQQ